MNKIIKLSALLLCGLGVFASCDDDRDNNPTLQTPTTFELNTPVFAGTDVDLRATDSLAFSWSQPAYGFPVAASYEMQFSPENDWSVSVETALADESGKTVPTFGSAGGVKSIVSSNVEGKDLATILQRCEKWKEDAVPATQKVYARCMAVYASDTIYSNVVSFNVVPYYVELKNAAPLEWYLIGSAVGDGSWGNNGTANIGTSIIPLYPITGQTYDAKTGTGIISITDYFPAGGQFKLIAKPGSWDVNVGYAGFTNIENNSAFDKNDDGNVVVNTAGYYTIKLDTKTNKATIEEYTGTTNKYATMYITGDFDSWGFTTGMTAFSTFSGSENHDWVRDVTISADGGLKFTSDNSWKFNWGSTEWSYGTGIAGGSNIPAKAGTYQVFFNDITGQYIFLEK
jgi:hypothetical protein